MDAIAQGVPIRIKQKHYWQAIFCHTCSSFYLAQYSVAEKKKEDTIKILVTRYKVICPQCKAQPTP